MIKRAVRARGNRNQAIPVTAEESPGGRPSAPARGLMSAVSEVEAVSTGAIRFVRDVLVMTVSGAAWIGAEALVVVAAAARGVVSSASALAGDMGGTAPRLDTAARSSMTQVGTAAHMAASPTTAATTTDEAVTTAKPAKRRARRSRTRVRVATRGGRRRKAA